MYPKLNYVSKVSLVDIIYGNYVDIENSSSFWVPFHHLLQQIYLFHFNQCLTCLLYLKNGLLPIMLQQGCNNALPLVDDEFIHMKCSLQKIS